MIDHREGDARLERSVGRVLRAGVVVSSSSLAVGLALTLGWGVGPWEIGLLSGGLIVLLATPVARVVISVLGYALERDWLFAALTAIVLLELVGSMLVKVN